MHGLLSEKCALSVFFGTGLANGRLPAQASQTPEALVQDHEPAGVLAGLRRRGSLTVSISDDELTGGVSFMQTSSYPMRSRDEWPSSPGDGKLGGRPTTVATRAHESGASSAALRIRSAGGATGRDNWLCQGCVPRQQSPGSLDAGPRNLAPLECRHCLCRAVAAACD